MSLGVVTEPQLTFPHQVELRVERELRGHRVRHLLEADREGEADWFSGDAAVGSQGWFMVDGVLKLIIFPKTICLFVCLCYTFI